MNDRFAILRRALSVLAILLLPGWLSAPGAHAADSPAGRKVLYVNSYHPGYPWSDGEQAGALGSLERAGVTVKAVYLDANRRQDEASIRTAASEAMAECEAFAPDVVIAADDPAQKYFVVPFLLGGSIPVVFCGVNWDATMYGYPTPNVTGMVEKDLVEQAVAKMRTYAKGDRIGYLAPAVNAGFKNCETYNAAFFNGGLKCYLVSSRREFQDAFTRAQQEVDMLLILNEEGIRDWRWEEVRDFMSAHVKIPVSGFHVYFADYSVFTFGKVPEEQGEWAAGAALKILEGAKPSEIPQAENVRAHLVVNIRMAQAAGIVLPVSLLKTAEVIGR